MIYPNNGRGMISDWLFIHNFYSLILQTDNGAGNILQQIFYANQSEIQDLSIRLPVYIFILFPLVWSHLILFVFFVFFSLSPLQRQQFWVMTAACIWRSSCHSPCTQRRRTWRCASCPSGRTACSWPPPPKSLQTPCDWSWMEAASNSRSTSVGHQESLLTISLPQSPHPHPHPALLFSQIDMMCWLSNHVFIFYCMISVNNRKSF